MVVDAPAAGSANAANPRNYTSLVVSVTSPLVRRRDARGVDGSWHMAVLFRCIESYGVVAPLEDDCHPCVQDESRADRLPRPRPTSAPQASIFKRLLRRRSLARPWTLLRELDAVGEAHVYAQATGARATTAREHVRIITGRRPRADDARPQHITLGQPAGACLQVLTTCRSAASRRASAAVRALREPTCLSIVKASCRRLATMLMLTEMLSQQCVTAATCRRTQPFADHTRGYKRSARSAMRPRRC